VKSGTPDEQLLVRYLLGELPEEECIELEQLCLEREELFEELEAVEAELSDDYVRGVLVGRRRKEFEKRLLNTPGRAEEIQFARLLARGANKRHSLFDGLKVWTQGSGLHTRLMQTSLAAATLALVVLVGSLSFRYWAKPERSQISRTSSSTTDSETVHKTVARTHTPPPVPSQVPSIATFTLTAGSTRGEGGGNEIKIPREANRVQFRIELASSDHKTYNVLLNRVEGERLFVQSNLKTRRSKAGEILTVQVPANVLSSGTSVLSVTAMGANGAPEDVGKYVIRIHAQ
jgi:anti-sigma factor RsiW